ncbi:hypothetical protein SAMN04490357_0346 [Streptomyces misionensis]|uniref:Tat pathway signal sequence domain protein n=1 Tax=Streptomyces misionensis TaxID=67331 RepID=A0A1H4M1N2_9ACTN|nr:hypothetical protein [Streptomyces misionensis]SEB77010.1 hypothetical protein SAMN04490357_0346 [Streptomyces misionensis]
MNTTKRAALALGSALCAIAAISGPAAQALDNPAPAHASTAPKTAETFKSAKAVKSVKTVNKYKSFSCGGGRVKVWYRDYDNNRTMLRETYLKDEIGLKFMTASAIWRADGGRTTIQKLWMEERGFPTVHDSQTKDVAVAKRRHPYVKVTIHTPFDTCHGYIHLY